MFSYDFFKIQKFKKKQISCLIHVLTLNFL